MSGGEQIHISGSVQGVGFRPHVWRLATELGLHGSVRNEGGAVVVELWGDAAQRESLVARLAAEAPPLARIDAIERAPLSHAFEGDGFAIETSREGDSGSGLSHDAALCPDCLRELHDPADRRHRYPFINCSHCGPRLSITRALPYDRAATSMAPFALCPACAEEYGDPADRRFHAQATACPECGPRLWLTDGEGAVQAEGGGAIEQAAQQILRGGIVAVKGIGGFHLACDAGNDEAVARLRRRKRRPHKPFAVMALELEMAARLADVAGEEGRLLQSAAAPIVLLDARGDSGLSGEVAPGLHSIGVMLAYSGLHRLLLQAVGRPLVMTSGNRSGEPLTADNDEAQQQLGAIADAFLLHDRAIVHRLDDSVVRLIGGKPCLLRRARGYAPDSLPLPPGFANADNILAMGAEMKGSFCLLQQGRLHPSHYLGELSSLGNFDHYRRTIDDLAALFRFTPGCIAVDAHPGYHASQWGETLARRDGLALVSVQHHHAHIAACMGEHGLPRETRPLLGIALDGLGYGDDATLWGGEFLLTDYRGYSRLAAFEAVALPGGDAANREPWRNAYAQLHHALGWESVIEEFGALAVIERLQQKPVETLATMIERGVNSPLSSSCGRLFDAAAALLGIRFDGISYEGQAAVELEQLATQSFAGQRPYPVAFTLQEGIQRIEWGAMWRALLQELQQGVEASIIAARFHHTVIEAVVAQTGQLLARHNFDSVALCGGVMQNRLIAEGLSAGLEGMGLRVLLPAVLPSNDGGIALGQALVAAVKGL